MTAIKSDDELTELGVPFFIGVLRALSCQTGITGELEQKYILLQLARVRAANLVAGVFGTPLPVVASSQHLCVHPSRALP